MQSTLFSILMILLNKRQVTREYLAERFSVCKRTVSRYIAALEDAGVPIISTPGTGGGLRIADDFRLDKTFLSEAETIRIRQALANSAKDFDDNANTAIIEKLDNMQKSRIVDKCVINQDDLYIDCDFEQAELVKPKITTFMRAIESRRVVDLTYTDTHGARSFRAVEPYTIVFKNGAWYIYAMCRLRGDFRLFKLSRIKDMRITSKSFARGESRLIEKLQLEYYNELYIDLEIEFFPTITENIVDWLGVAAISERGAKLIAHTEVPYNSALVKRILSFGSSIKVLAPEELKTAIAEEATRIYANYHK